MHMEFRYFNDYANNGDLPHFMKEGKPGQAWRIVQVLKTIPKHVK